MRIHRHGGPSRPAEDGHDDALPGPGPDPWDSAAWAVAGAPAQAGPLRPPGERPADGEAGGPHGAAIAVADPKAVPSGGVGASYGQTFSLHSNPGSGFKVYLDFDGHENYDADWRSYFGTGASPVVVPAFSADADQGGFNEAELAAIQRIWQRLAEYFAPFNIDVTTEDPGAEGLRRTAAGDAAFGMRVVVTEQPNGAGGLAYVGSFDGPTDKGCYVFSASLGHDADTIADAAAHEVGHTLGLSHDGQRAGIATAEYYYGHGGGVTDWAPVMGAGYYANIVQWSEGEYYGATQLEDDLAIITTQNSGVAYRADEAGGDFATAARLGGSAAAGVTTVARWGVIAGSGPQNDVDMYALDVGAGGSVSLTIAPWTQVFVTGGAGPIYDPSPFSMLDLQVEVYDPSRVRIATINDPGSLGAVVNLSGLAAGTYYLALDGVGFGDPFAAAPTGYTEYGSLGQYMIRGTYSSGPAPAGGALMFSKSAAATSEAGGSDSFGVFLDYAGGAPPPGGVLVQIGGLDATEGALGQTAVLLDQHNGWRVDNITLVGRDDRDAEPGGSAYTLIATAAGYGPASMTVRNANDDVAPADAGGAGASLGRWKREPAASNGTVAALSADDGNAMTIGEGTIGRAQRMEWVWRFDNLAPDGGTVTVQIDAASTEAFQFQCSADGLAWSDLGARGTSWNGAYDVLFPKPGSLWVRIVDLAAASDASRSSIAIDLLTVAHGLAAPAASGADWLP